MNTDQTLNELQAACLELAGAGESIDHRDASMRLTAARRRIHTELWTWRVVVAVAVLVAVICAAM